MQKVRARRILLTGSEGGIGSVIHQRLRDGGDDVICLGHRGAATNGVLVNFRDDDEVEAAVKAVAKPLDGVVLAHGMLKGGSVFDVKPSEWREVLDANLNSVYTIVHAAVRQIERGGSIVLISSTAALDHSPTGGGHYTVSKWGINGMVRHLAFDLGPRGIRINSVCPGTVDTPMARIFAEKEADEIARIPLQRMGDPTEISAAVEFLLSDAASYVTGANIPVSGGYR